MTYSRHYPLLEQVYEALEGDLAKTVVFFKQVDKLKPTAVAVMKQHRISDGKSVQFVRAYESAVVQTIEAALKAHRRRRGE